MMSDLEKVVDKFSGFITKAQAEEILKTDVTHNVTDFRKINFTAKDLISFMGGKSEKQPKLEDKEMIVNIKDYIYRIFNPTSINVKGKELSKRVLIVGEEGSTVTLNLRDKLSEFIDINAFERGDFVSVNNAGLDLSTGELKSVQGTVINKVAPSKKAIINDFSAINEELRKVDAIGRMLEISPIRHVNRLGRSGQIAVASCVISDSVNAVYASFWGSSALLTANMKTNDIVKMEFCDIRNRDGKYQIYANDNSRVVASSLFANRLKK